MSAAAHLTPSSAFPFSPLTGDEATRRGRFTAAVIAGHVVDDPAWFVPQYPGERVVVAIRQRYVDMRAGTDVRCRYVRDYGPDA